MDKLKQEYQVETRWVGFPLHPETPQEGQTLEELFRGRNFDVREAMAHMASVAASLGLPFGQRSMTYNSRRAQELAKWAEEQGRLEEYNRAAFHVYFAEGRNIAELPVLEDIAARAGLDPAGVAPALAESRFAAAVDRDWAQSRKLGVTAVPTFLAGLEAVVGAQPYTSLEKLVQTAGAVRRG
ncbi:MAG: DsbA family protein [Deltaproteobacteria bacterium]|nr:DsbA family protein [Deltaproteobacteria bacterium]